MAHAYTVTSDVHAYKNPTKQHGAENAENKERHPQQWRHRGVLKDQLPSKKILAGRKQNDQQSKVIQENFKQRISILLIVESSRQFNAVK